MVVAPIKPIQPTRPALPPEAVARTLQVLKGREKARQEIVYKKRATPIKQSTLNSFTNQITDYKNRIVEYQRKIAQLRFKKKREEIDKYEDRINATKIGLKELQKLKADYEKLDWKEVLGHGEDYGIKAINYVGELRVYELRKAEARRERRRLIKFKPITSTEKSLYDFQLQTFKDAGYKANEAKALAQWSVKNQQTPDPEKQKQIIKNYQALGILPVTFETPFKWVEKAYKESQAEYKRYKNLGYSASDARILATESLKKGGITFTPNYANKILETEYKKREKEIERQKLEYISGGAERALEKVKRGEISPFEIAPAVIKELKDRALWYPKKWVSKVAETAATYAIPTVQEAILNFGKATGQLSESDVKLVKEKIKKSYELDDSTKSSFIKIIEGKPLTPKDVGKITAGSLEIAKYTIPGVFAIEAGGWLIGQEAKIVRETMRDMQKGDDFLTALKSRGATIYSGKYDKESGGIAMRTLAENMDLIDKSRRQVLIGVGVGLTALAVMAGAGTLYASSKYFAAKKYKSELMSYNKAKAQFDKIVKIRKAKPKIIEEDLAIRVGKKFKYTSAKHSAQIRKFTNELKVLRDINLKNIKSFEISASTQRTVELVPKMFRHSPKEILGKFIKAGEKISKSLRRRLMKENVYYVADVPKTYYVNTVDYAVILKDGRTIVQSIVVRSTKPISSFKSGASAIKWSVGKRFVIERSIPGTELVAAKVYRFRGKKVIMEGEYIGKPIEKMIGREKIRVLEVRKVPEIKKIVPEMTAEEYFELAPRVARVVTKRKVAKEVPFERLVPGKVIEAPMIKTADEVFLTGMERPFLSVSRIAKENWVLDSSILQKLLQTRAKFLSQTIKISKMTRAQKSVISLAKKATKAVKSGKSTLLLKSKEVLKVPSVVRTNIASAVIKTVPKVKPLPPPVPSMVTMGVAPAVSMYAGAGVYERTMANTISGIRNSLIGVTGKLNLIQRDVLDKSFMGIGILPTEIKKISNKLKSQLKQLTKIKNTLESGEAKTKSKLVILLKQPIAMRSSQDVRNISQNKQNMAQILSLQTKIKSLMKQISSITQTIKPPKVKPTRFKIPKIGLPPFPKKKKIKKKPIKMVGEYKVVVRKKGKWRVVGKARTGTLAARLLKRHLRKTLRASGYIEKNGKRLRVNLGAGFRQSKTLKNVVVQVLRQRLGTREEVKAIKRAKRIAPKKAKKKAVKSSNNRKRTSTPKRKMTIHRKRIRPKSITKMTDKEFFFR